MSNQIESIVAHMIAFNKENDIADRDIALELTDRLPDARIEVAFDVPKGATRMYLTFDQLDLLRLAIRKDPT